MAQPPSFASKRVARFFSFLLVGFSNGAVSAAIHVPKEAASKSHAQTHNITHPKISIPSSLAVGIKKGRQPKGVGQPALPSKHEPRRSSPPAKHQQEPLMNETKTSAASATLGLSDAARSCVGLPTMEESCRAVERAKDLTHLIMLSGPRHGTSFISSLIADENSVLYLGELFNRGAFMAHANIVDAKTTVDVKKLFSKEFDGKDEAIRLAPSGFLDSEKGLRRGLQVIENFATNQKRYNTVIYKILSVTPPSTTWVHFLRRDRCVRFFILQRNALHVMASTFFTTTTHHFVGANNTGKEKFELTPQFAKDSLSNMMRVAVGYAEMINGNIGGTYVAQYETFLNMEQNPTHNMRYILQHIRDTISAGLGEAARNAAEANNGTSAADIDYDNKTHAVLCHERLSKRTTELYTRQDSRDRLQDKIQNYEEWEKHWPAFCNEVAEAYAGAVDCGEQEWQFPE